MTPITPPPRCAKPPRKSACRPRACDVLGQLSPYETVSGYRVLPIVGWIEPPFELAPDPVEVADVFEVPLDFILDTANHQRHHRMLGEIRRDYWAIPWLHRYIWGATAAMLLILERTLRDGLTLEQARPILIPDPCH